MWALPAAGTAAVLVAAGALYLRAARNPSVVEGLAFAWVGGWGGVNLALFSLDQFLGVRLTTLLASILSVSALLIAVALLWPVRARFPAWRTGLSRRLGRAGRALRNEPLLAAGAALVGLFLVLAIFKAVSLPVMNTDAVAYHAVIPREAFRDGSLPTDVGPAWTEWARAFPDFLETQELWLYLLDGSANDLWARPLVPVSFGLLALLVAQQAWRRSGSRLAAVAAPTLLLSLPELPIWTTQLFVEVPVALAVLAGAALLVSAIEEDDRRLLVLAGLVLGIAGLVKYNGVLMGGILAVAGAVVLRSRPARVPLLLLPWALPAAVILGRNWLLFGNPVYPFFAEVFGGKNLGLLSMFPAYTQVELGKARAYEGIEIASALPLVLGIPAVLSRPFRKAPLAWKLFLSASLLYLLAYIFFQFRGSHIRYLFPAIPMFAMVAGWAIAEGAKGDHRAFHVVEGSLAVAIGLLATIVAGTGGYSGDPHARWVALSGLCLASVLLVLLWLLHISPKSLARLGRPVGDPRKALSPLITGRPRTAVVMAVAVLLFLPSFPTMLVVGYPGEERAGSDPLEGLSVPARDQALERRFGDDYLMWNWVNANLPRNSTIISFDPRVYYIEREVLPATSYRLTGTYSVPLAKAVNASMRQGATHILDSPWPRGIEVIRPFYERSVLFHNLGNATCFTLVHSEGDVRLYRILEGGAGNAG